MNEMVQAGGYPERESMQFDVVIVGAGPAGLSAAIRLKQINPDLSVVILEKGPEVGAHILSGAVVDPIGIDRLLPGWRDEEEHPFKVQVTQDHFVILGRSGALRVPSFLMPPLMSNHGNFIVSLGNVCRWLANKAEALGVEIYAGFAAAEVLYNDAGAVIGVATGDMGIERNGEPGPNYTRGMALLGKYVLIGEAYAARWPSSSLPASVWTRIVSPRSSASASRSCGRSSPSTTSRAWCSTPSAGRST